MPAINVSRTDTFESQRQKINEIGANLFQISQGGSDLSTGNLKLGDGLKSTPSLGFINQASLGIYRPTPGVISFVSDGKKLLDTGVETIVSYRDFVIQQNVIQDSNISLLDTGENYDPGTYTNIPLTGGTGDLATVDLVVDNFEGTVTSPGANYNPGTYSNIVLEGGTGTGTIIAFEVPGIVGDITEPGSGYAPAEYTGVSLINGSGTGAEATITVEGTSTLTGSVTNKGTLYADNVYLDIPLRNNPTQTFVVTSIANPGTPPPNSVYQIDGVTQDTIDFVVGNTYRFDLSDSSLSTHPFIFETTAGGTLDFNLYTTNASGTIGTAGAYIDIVVSPSVPTGGQIRYDCSAHDGMGGFINITTGAAGVSGSGARADFEVISGAVENFTLTNEGTGYKTTDILVLDPTFDGSGAGSGFQYTVSGVTNTGVVTGVTITNSGQNYVITDVLSANTSDIGGTGSGFQFTVSSNPGVITNLAFDTKGTGYSVGDVLQTPQGVTGITASLKAEITGVSGTVVAGTTDLNVSSTSNLVDGMTVGVTGGTGSVPPDTTITVTSPTLLTLSAPADITGPVTCTFISPGNLAEITPSSLTGIAVGDIVTKTGGTGDLASGETTVDSIDDFSGTLILSQNPSVPGSVTLSFSPALGTGTSDFQYTIEKLGSISSYEINNSGNGYDVNDVLSVSPTDLVQPIQYTVTNVEQETVTFTNPLSASFFSVGDTLERDDTGIVISADVLAVNSTGGSLDSIIVASQGFNAGDTVTKGGDTTPLTVNTSVSKFRYYLDDGNGAQQTPNLTFYVGNTYLFDLSDSSNSSHIFALSKFRDGIHPPSSISSINTTLDTNTNQITVASTTGILEGMEIVVDSGDGEVLVGTVVASVDNATTITLTNNPITSGTSVVTFRGVEYTDGVTRTGGNLTIKVTDTTPNLYYYCAIDDASHGDEGGDDNIEALITVDSNNPKVFGSGFSITLPTITSDDVISLDVGDGELSSKSFTTIDASFTNTSTSGTSTSGTVIANTVSTPILSSGTSLNIATSTVDVSGNLNVGSGIQMTESNGRITTSGQIKTTNIFNSNDELTITGSIIGSTANYDVVLKPFQSRITKVDSLTALQVPKGTTGDRPAQSYDGYIRFNTETNQYEGFSENADAWSSLGGVRDLDGNTTILAEESVGSNDNTLWFINDNVNTVKFTPSHLSFESVKRIRSSNTSAPDYKEWIANDPSNLGDYIKYRNNIFEVTAVANPGGTNLTGTTGSEPTDTTGNNITNGDLTLVYHSSAVANVTFEEVNEVQIDPLGFTDLVINGELRFSNNIMSSEINDIIIKPTGTQKLIIETTSSLVIPVGDNNSKGTPAQGSIRYNTDDTQFEGFNGVQWGGLGGVKDVDQDTKITAESAPAADEDVLAFFNANDNTLNLTTTRLEFNTIDTIKSTGSDTLNLNASTITFNDLATTLDNDSTTESFLFTTKDNFDFGLSTGVLTDHLVRLTNTGSIIYNLGFGTGTPNNLTVLDSTLTNYELAHVKTNTSKLDLERGTLNAANTTVYNPSTEASATVVLTAHNTTTGDKEVIEYLVTDKGTDIFFTETNTTKTGSELVSTVFDFDSSNNVRLTVNLDNGLTTGDLVFVTIIKTVTKR